MKPTVYGQSRDAGEFVDSNDNIGERSMLLFALSLWVLEKLTNTQSKGKGARDTILSGARSEPFYWSKIQVH